MPVESSWVHVVALSGAILTCEPEALSPAHITGAVSPRLARGAPRGGQQEAAQRRWPSLWGQGLPTGREATQCPVISRPRLVDPNLGRGTISAETPLL